MNEAALLFEAVIVPEKIHAFFKKRALITFFVTMLLAAIVAGFGAQEEIYFIVSLANLVIAAAWVLLAVRVFVLPHKYGDAAAMGQILSFLALAVVFGYFTYDPYPTMVVWAVIGVILDILLSA